MPPVASVVCGSVSAVADRQDVDTVLGEFDGRSQAYLSRPHGLALL
jgi:hypothetical protein